MAANKVKVIDRRKAAKRAKRSVINSAATFEAILRRASNRENYSLCLYITGTTSRSAEAIANIRALCEEHLSGRYELEVVDIYQQPHKAAGNQIVAAPTLIKSLPAPARRIIGDLSNRDRVLVGLNLKPIHSGKANEETQWVEI